MGEPFACDRSAAGTRRAGGCHSSDGEITQRDCRETGSGSPGTAETTGERLSGIGKGAPEGTSAAGCGYSATSARAERGRTEAPEGAGGCQSPNSEGSD